ncbi:MAG: universal stress protein [Gammaproteobacteria bacterium]|nr:universal stress protein [Gammaproteobacteria bacterium]
MQNYSKILVATELDATTDLLILSKAKQIAEQNNAALYLVHAVEHINAYNTAAAYPAIADIETQISAEHKSALTTLGQTYNIAAERQFIDMGSPAVIVANKARDIQADLIIVGSHSRHGLALLLGSTTDSILHKANCDILAVRLANH